MMPFMRDQREFHEVDQWKNTLLFGDSHTMGKCILGSGNHVPGTSLGMSDPCSGEVVSCLWKREEKPLEGNTPAGFSFMFN